MSHKRWFIDTGYWLALFNLGDRHHERARALALSIPGPFVTTESVLQEVANALANPPQRIKAVTLIEAVLEDDKIEVVPIGPDLFGRGFDLYKQRPDKGWALTDCVSFAVMREMDIVEALCNDHHFRQAGFRALLLEDASET